jgi:hypothetical protein
MERRVRHKETAGVLLIQQANIMNLVIPSWSGVGWYGIRPVSCASVRMRMIRLMRTIFGKFAAYRIQQNFKEHVYES